MATELLSRPIEVDQAPASQAGPVDPVLGSVTFDEDGLLRIGRRWVAFPEVEQRLVEVLVDHAGHLVRRDDLAEAAWPGQPIDDDLIYLRIGRARRRIEPYGLTIVAVRGRGYVLDLRPI